MNDRPIYTYHFADGKELTVGGRTLVMGILNVTPDSFSDGGRFDTVEKARAHMREMVADGADLIDIGAESTRPGSAALTPEEEQARLLPFLEAIVPECPVPISVDTYHAATARAAASAGVHILNDIWGLQYEEEPGEMARVAAETGLPVIVMHNQHGKSYAGDVIETMQGFFRRSLAIAREAGVKREQVILDPGIGFGKDTAANLLVQRRLAELLAVDGVRYPACVNIGVHPTVGALPAPLLEANLIGFAGDLYGKELAVWLQAHLRGEMRFESAAALRARVLYDRQLVADYYQK